MKNKFKLTVFICAIFSLCIGIFYGCNKVNSVNTDNPINDFLSSNFSKLDISDNDDFSSFKLLDKSLKGKKVFFTAEEHGVFANTEIGLKFLKYFKKKAGIKYYLNELSYSDACFLNQYLQSGDEKILEELYKPLKGTFAWNKQGYEKWKKVYEFNKALPKNEKIKIIGIDVEHQPITALRYMCSIIPKEEAPLQITPLLKELNKIYNAKDSSREDIKNFSLKLQKSIKENIDVYSKYFGDNFFGFNIVNENILNMFEAYEDRRDFNQIRDKKMYDNFAAIYKNIPKGKFYGQFGLNHVFQKKQIYVDWLASLMNGENSPVKGKVLSIIYIYKDCKGMMNGDYRVVDLTTLNLTPKIFDEFLKSDFTLFKLEGKNSPFKKSLIWPLDEEHTGMKPKDGVTTDCFQFAVVIKNSKETEPLNQ